jgi:glucokinase
MLLAIDTGGTKTLIAAFRHDGTVASSHKFATPLDQEEYVSEIKRIIFEHYSHKKLDAVIVALPGEIKNNIALWCGNLPWNNFDVAGALADVVSCPIWVENDANLAGLAETRALPQPAALSLYATISTGIGTGIIIDGKIIPALSGSEGGHMLVEYDGIVRKWESFASGHAIRETYDAYAHDIHDRRIWNQIADKISRGFLVLIPALQPDVIIIGGSIGTYFDQYGPALKKHLHQHLPPEIRLPEIRQATRPEEAVIYGCYYYGIDQLATT